MPLNPLHHTRRAAAPLCCAGALVACDTPLRYGRQAVHPNPPKPARHFSAAAGPDGVEHREKTLLSAGSDSTAPAESRVNLNARYDHEYAGAAVQDQQDTTNLRKALFRAASGPQKYGANQSATKDKPSPQDVSKQAKARLA